MTSPITLVEAINQALRYEMRQDENVIVLGEDVGANGGVFRATVDLFKEFGLRLAPRYAPAKLTCKSFNFLIGGKEFVVVKDK